MAAGTPEGAAGLQAQASSIGRALGMNDALIADSAMQEGTPLITGDQQLLRFLSRGDVLDWATQIDQKLGLFFKPPVL